MKKSQVERMDKINKLIELVGDTDRGFFKSKNGRARFKEIKTTVKFIDGYTQKELTVTKDGKCMKGFSSGGTLQALVRDFKRWILTGKYSNGYHGYGGLYSTSWGYSLEGQNKIVEFAKKIGYINHQAKTFKDYAYNLYKDGSWMLGETLKKEIEKTQNNIAT